jgi:hypothetical protein
VSWAEHQCCVAQEKAFSPGLQQPRACWRAGQGSGSLPKDTREGAWGARRGRCGGRGRQGRPTTAAGGECAAGRVAPGRGGDALRPREAAENKAKVMDPCAVVLAPLGVAYGALTSGGCCCRPAGGVGAASHRPRGVAELTGRRGAQKPCRYRKMCFSCFGLASCEGVCRREVFCVLLCSRG